MAAIQKVSNVVRPQHLRNGEFDLVVAEVVLADTQMFRLTKVQRLPQQHALTDFPRN